jgi:hypothetical protein
MRAAVRLAQLPTRINHIIEGANPDIEPIIDINMMVQLEFLDLACLDSGGDRLSQFNAAKAVRNAI